jgi:uncharacterized membrane protein YdjX (TVP38/TMEM64 family)
MKISEEAVFRWVLIVMIAAITVILVTVVAGSLAGALWGLVLVIAGSVYGYRWSRERWRRLGAKKK